MKAQTIFRIGIMVCSWMLTAVIVAKLVNAAAVKLKTDAITMRKVCRVNLALACFVTLLAVFAYCTPSRNPPPQDYAAFNNRVRMLTAGEIVVLGSWLGGAIGLFFRKRLAWYGSLLGSGVMVFLASCAVLGITYAIIFLAKDVMMPTGNRWGFYLFMVPMMLFFFVFPLTLFCWLVFGLLRISREIFIKRPMGSGSSVSELK